MFSTRVIRLAAASSALILAAGCGTGATSYTPAGQAGQTPAAGTSAGAAAGGAKTHLVFFNARGAEVAERKLVERYMKDHPDIEIEYLSTTTLSGPSDTDAIANLIFNIQANRVVDVAKIEVSRTPLDLMAANASKELTAIGGDQVKTRAQALLNADYVTVNNGIWALPYEYDPFGYVYDASMYKDAGLDPDKPPATWDELRAVNNALKAKDPTVWPICQPIKNLAKTLPIIWNAGGDIWDRDVLPTKALFVNPIVSDSYKFLQEWSQKQWMNTDEMTGDNQNQLLISRKCAALNGSSNAVLGLQSNDPKTDWRVAPFPSKAAGNSQPVTFGGGSALAIPSTAAHPKEALDFMLWLTGDDAQRLKWGVNKDLGLSDDDIFASSIPVNKTVADDLKKDAKWKQAVLTIPSRPAGISPAYSKIYDLMASMQERIIRSNANVDEELTSVQKQAQDLLDQSIASYPSLYKGA
jgi:multiple sugar transport system substrate-binding protein